MVTRENTNGYQEFISNDMKAHFNTIFVRVIQKGL